MSNLQNKFRACAIDLLREASDVNPPADCHTVLLETMVAEVVQPSGQVRPELTMAAIRASTTLLSYGQERELSDNEIKAVISRHFDLR